MQVQGKRFFRDETMANRFVFLRLQRLALLQKPILSVDTKVLTDLKMEQKEASLVNLPPVSRSKILQHLMA